MDNISLGGAIFADIDRNPYLNELYDNILYNYSLTVFKRDAEKKVVDCEAALRFADLLSRSKSDRHRIWAQEIVALLQATEPDSPVVEYYLGAILSSIGNYRGMAHMKHGYISRNLLDRFYTEFSRELMCVPADRDKQFFRSQKEVYDNFTEQYFSYSGPTSMGKSFIMRMFIKEKVMSGEGLNFCLLVPTKALINEVSHKIIFEDLDKLLQEKQYTVVTSAGSLALEKEGNFIFVLTPERLLYLLIGRPDIRIDYLFVDEAHKISEHDSRSTFYYKVIDMLDQRSAKPHVIFSSPNIPNPEIYLRLIPNIMEQSKGLATSYSPVSQVKFFVDFQAGEICQYNATNATLSTISRYNGDFCSLLKTIGQSSFDGHKPQNIVYCSGTNKAMELAQKFASAQPVLQNDDLRKLAKDIGAEVHKDYYLADVITRGVAYHIGYLPSAIRMRIEEQFCKGNIHTIFCTSTLVEGVNLPADNLFVTSHYNGTTKMKSVDFRNLIGRVGRIEFNLYGNVFLVRLADDKRVKTTEYEKLLSEEIPKQSLSVVTALTKKQKERIVSALAEGEFEFGATRS
jgi:hypothetical protein